MTLTDQTPTTRRAGLADRDEVARVLTSAFLDDPVFAWIVPDRAELAPMLPPLFAAFADAFARHDETRILQVPAAAGTTTTGVAMWAPPGAPPVHRDDEEHLDAAVAGVAGAHLDRFGTCIEIFEAAHPTEPCWYLQFLGVDTAHQGRGHGSALLRDVLDGADRAGQAAYLEATSQRNRALYERHGFRSVGELVLPDGPTAYAMWREPAGRA